MVSSGLLDLSRGFPTSRSVLRCFVRGGVPDFLLGGKNGNQQEGRGDPIVFGKKGHLLRTTRKWALMFSRGFLSFGCPPNNAGLGTLFSEEKTHANGLAPVPHCWAPAGTTLAAVGRSSSPRPASPRRDGNSRWNPHTF